MDAIRRQLPPSASAVDFARDRRTVHRERRRVVRLAVRWEHPAVGRGEHHREVDEHRISWSGGHIIVDTAALNGDSTGNHWQPLRRPQVGMVGLRPLARHTGPGHVRSEGGAQGGSGADEDERAEARRALRRLRVLVLGDGQVMECLVRGWASMGPGDWVKAEQLDFDATGGKGGRGRVGRRRGEKGTSGLHLRDCRGALRDVERHVVRLRR